MFIDLQNNGYAGVDFNGGPLTAEQLQYIHQKLIAADNRAILPTIITDDVTRMAKRAADLRKLIDQQPDWRRMFCAFHLEGPCLSPEDGYRGAHPLEHIRPASRDLPAPVIDAAGGPDRVAIVTLAPEMDENLATTKWLADQGIIVAAGHTNAPYDMLRKAVHNGLRLFTHLSNGCKPLIARHDNIINRALAIDALTCTFIADGHHIPYFVLKGWLKQAGIERSIFVTDCMAAADAPPGTYRVGQWQLEVGADRLVHPPGADHLAGSALTMPQAFAHATAPDKLALPEPAARALCADNPARLIAPWLERAET